jgi:MipA family protein
MRSMGSTKGAAQGVWRALTGLSLACGAHACVWAAGPTTPQPCAPSACEGAAAENADQPADAPRMQRTPPAAATKFEGAVGLVMTVGPAFAGSTDVVLKPSLAGFIRYGRYTLTGPGGFTTRRSDDVQRGLSTDVLRTEHLRINLSLRVDNGRRASSSPQLSGLGDIDSTLRMRLGARWAPSPHWSMVAGTNLDLLGRVGGAVLDVGVSHAWPWSPTSALSLGAGVTAGSRRTMQAWHGVTAEQAAASGYARYTPSAGLRDASVAVTWRQEWPEARWALYATASASRLLGPAAASPLALQRDGWRLSSGLARRF